MRESTLDKRLRKAAYEISEAEACEERARKTNFDPDFWVRMAGFNRRRADRLLDIDERVCPYGTTEPRVIDLAIQREVARMVAHADSVAECKRHLSNRAAVALAQAVREDEEFEDLW